MRRQRAGQPGEPDGAGQGAGRAAGAAADGTAPFRGYNPIRYTPCPDEFFDQQMAHMDDDELRVTLYAFRRTFGFKKTDDAISLSQFLQGIVTRDGRRLDYGCGLKTPRQVLAGLAKAEQRRTLLSAFYCRACGAAVPEEAMLVEERRQRLVNGEERQYQVRVVPRHCPACGARLRGFEEKRYHLHVLDEAGAVAAPSPSIPAIDPPGAPPPSVAPTVPPYPAARGASAYETETRNRDQETGQQMAPAPEDCDVRGTTSGGAGRETAAATAGLAPVFVPPGSRLPAPQLWAAAVAQAAPALERVDREGWVRAAALLAADEPAGAGGQPLTLVVGLPSEYARRRCAGRAGVALAEGLALLLGRPVILRPVVTSVWLAER